MMKRMMLFSLLALALPLAAFADSSSDYNASGGMLAGNSAGLSYTGSELVSIGNASGTVAGNLGSVTFTTGALSSGSVQFGGTFAAGGTFSIVSNGLNGAPPAGTIFTGTFSSAVTWTLNPNGPVGKSMFPNEYSLTGNVTGTWSNGTSGSGNISLTLFSGKNPFNGSALVSSADTGFAGSAVPEPGTLGLLGTGLIGLAGVVRRKLKA